MGGRGNRKVRRVWGVKVKPEDDKGVREFKGN